MTAHNGSFLGRQTQFTLCTTQLDLAGVMLPLKDSESSALYYLMEYGYIHRSEDSSTSALLSADGIKKAVKEFQVKAGFNQMRES